VDTLHKGDNYDDDDDDDDDDDNNNNNKYFSASFFPTDYLPVNPSLSGW
jgi:hypothetical protein